MNSGVSPIQAKNERHAGIGPAIGNGNSSRQAERAAAPKRQRFCRIQAGVYRIPLPSPGSQLCLKSYSDSVRAAPHAPPSAIFCSSGPRGRIWAITIWGMHLAIFGMRLLEVMFFTGLIGSAVVVLISFVEDARELFGEE